MIQQSLLHSPYWQHAKSRGMPESKIGSKKKEEKEKKRETVGVLGKKGEGGEEN